MLNFIEVFKNDKEKIAQIASMAEIIWKEHYKDIIPLKQIEFMLKFFQSEGAIKTQLKEESYHYFIISENDTPAGYFAILPEENHVFLSKLYILKDFRNKGIARNALNEIKQIARKNKKNRIRLNVNKNNKSTIEAYQRFGFKITDSSMIYIGSGHILDDFIMEIEF